MHARGAAPACPQASAGPVSPLAHQGAGLPFPPPHPSTAPKLLPAAGPLRAEFFALLGLKVPGQRRLTYVHILARSYNRRHFPWFEMIEVCLCLCVCVCVQRGPGRGHPRGPPGPLPRDQGGGSACGRPGGQPTGAACSDPPCRHTFGDPTRRHCLGMAARGMPPSPLISSSAGRSSAS